MAIRLDCADEVRLADAEYVRAAGHEFWIFVESIPLLETMIRDIRLAQSRIWIETYIFHSDPKASEVANALSAKAREGVDVRVLYDAFGSMSTSVAFFENLTRAGVQVHAFHTIWDALRRFAPVQILNRRNHRKLLVVDEDVAYFGGMNIIDPSFDEARGESRETPTSGGWRDIHARMRGPKVCEIARSFERSWSRAVRDKLVSHVPLRIQPLGLSGELEQIRFFDSTPRSRFSSASRLFVRLLRRSRSELMIAMAYFLPTARVWRSILRAKRAGSRVRVLVPSESDVKLVQWACRHFYGKLLKNGIEVYERQERMLHSKAVVIDDEWTIIGSCNLDARSLIDNLEFVAVIRSKEMARTVRVLCEREMDRSRRVSPDYAMPLGRWQRILDQLAYWMRRWL